MSTNEKFGIKYILPILFNPSGGICPILSYLSISALKIFKIFLKDIF